MNSAIERLLTLRVEDVMNSPVAFIPHDVSMSDAARILTENEVTGAPVVNDQGQCIVILSATDFAERESRIASGDDASLQAGLFDHVAQQSPQPLTHILVCFFL